MEIGMNFYSDCFYVVSYMLCGFSLFAIEIWFARTSIISFKWIHISYWAIRLAITFLHDCYWITIIGMAYPQQFMIYVNNQTEDVEKHFSVRYAVQIFHWNSFYQSWHLKIALLIYLLDSISIKKFTVL